MKHRVIATLLCCQLLYLPGLAFAEDEEKSEDLDDLMADATDEEEGGDKSEGEEEGEGDDDANLESLMDADPEDGGGDVDSQVEDDFDADSMDEERPPGDPDAFVSTDDEVEEVEEEEEGRPPFSLGILVGFGLGTEEVNAWGFGFGLGAGYDLGLLNLGLRFGYYLGESITVERTDSFGNPLPGGTVEFTANIWELGLDVGLNINAGAGTIRPGLGVGFAASSGSSETNLSPFVAPGLALLYNTSSNMYLGLDARYQVVASDPSNSAIVLLATLGLRL